MTNIDTDPRDKPSLDALRRVHLWIADEIRNALYRQGIEISPHERRVLDALAFLEKNKAKTPVPYGTTPVDGYTIRQIATLFEIPVPSVRSALQSLEKEALVKRHKKPREGQRSDRWELTTEDDPATSRSGHDIRRRYNSVIHDVLSDVYGDLLNSESAEPFLAFARDADEQRIRGRCKRLVAD